MAYKIIVSSRAQREIENAIDYYALYSSNAPVKFISLLKDTYSTLKVNPLFKVQYKQYKNVEN